MATLSPKRIGKNFLCSILERQVRRLRATHEMQIVAVGGSIGKTSTKLAIAHMLEPTRRVIYQTGNYNDRLTVPLVIFGQKLPGLFNVPAWIRILLANERTIRLKDYYEVAVVELGTDAPGQIKKFAYLQPDIAVITAITPEHMEFFKTLDAVAAEELAVYDFSKKVLINGSDTPQEYLSGRSVETYGTGGNYAYRSIESTSQGLHGTDVTMQLGNEPLMTARAQILGRQGVKIVLAAAATGHLLGLSREEITTGLQEIKPFAGRMQVLRGIKDSTIIDDTYNANPVAVEAALDVLYGIEAPQRIAVLGSMKELGAYSQEAHEEVGMYCDPAKLDLVVTIGSDAEKYLVPAAVKKGCTVKAFVGPYEAGDFVQSQLKDGAVVLAEGSQNRVFAEESLKPLLADPHDAALLVRQTPYWMNIKKRQFRSV